jgi:thymidylate kinase
MTATPGEVFERYFSELDRHHLPYVVLHSYEDFPERFPSDVDHAVLDADLPKVWAIQADVAERCEWTLALTIRNQSHAFHTVLINPVNPVEYLQLDVCSHYLSHGCLLVRDRDLLDGRRTYKGFHIPAASSEFIYRLARLLIKRKDPAEHLPRLRALWGEDRQRAQQLWSSLLGSGVGSFEDWSRRPPEQWEWLRSRMVSRNRLRLRYQWQESKRLLHRIAYPIGIRVAILGPDGAGKSTLLPQLEALVRPCVRGQRIVHFCPMMFRRLEHAVMTEPHGKPPRTRVASWIKVLYYFLDHWLGFLVQELPGRIRGACTIYDRDFDDLLVDLKRYRIQHAIPLIKFLRPALPRMDLTIVLDVSPVVSHQRKPELTVEELGRLRAAYQSLAAGDRSFAVVSAEQPPELVARDAARAVVLALGAREKRRAGSPAG